MRAGVILDQGVSTIIPEPHPAFRAAGLQRISDHVLDTRVYLRRPTENPINAPMTTTTMITMRMVFPIPARKPRASRCAASRPA